MDLGLSGRTAVVGGATSGLGRASAEALAAEGCRLLIWSRNADALAATAVEIAAAHGVDVAHVSADAGSPDAAATVAEAAARLGGVDIVVLNAGGPPTVDPTATDPEGWSRALQLLAITPVELASRLLPGMRERGWGRVVAILSSGVRQPIADLVYSNAGRSVLAAWLKTTCARRTSPPSPPGATDVRKSSARWWRSWRPNGPRTSPASSWPWTAG